MINLVVFYFLASVVLYVLLGGADFGAGIVELFTRSKDRKQIIKIIDNAIAPIWEANHMWLIIAVVILFNAFPKIYTAITVYLYIPTIIVLLGIVLRGTAFIFRHYDVFKDGSQKIYTIVFRISSILVSFAFGLVIGALMSNKMTTSPSGFYEGDIAPWLNIFSVCVGIFVTALFAFIASVYLIGEEINPEEKKVFISKAKVAGIILIFSGGLVFISSELTGNNFTLLFMSGWKAQALIITATLAMPFTWKVISNGMAWLARFFAGFQVVLILFGFYLAYFPVAVRYDNTESLTFYNSVAPGATLSYLGCALLVGSCIIFPLLGYLLKVFKHR